MRRLILWVPLAIFLVVGLVAIVGLLRPSDNVIRSRLVGQQLPAVQLPAAVPGRATIRSADFTAGQPRVLNIFASWCVPCIAEAPQLMALSRRGVPIDAVAIRDRAPDVADFLSRWGDPYRNIGLDVDSSLQLAVGSSGVPETFIVDGRGVIRYQHVGPLTDADVPAILAELEKAR